jgi:isopentenyl diphosphate isomerase/L-lactate dehydrogenase-like FMN-dependent dehydrogenase
MGQLLSVADYREKARRFLPRLVFDYVDGGAETESTVRANRAAFDAVTVKPYGGVDPAPIDLGTDVFGITQSFPVILAPCGMTRLVRNSGDIAAARAAAASGIPFCIPTMSGHTIEDAARAGDPSRLWYQLYRLGPHERVAAAIARAKKVGIGTLVVTFDTSTISLRERDVRNGGIALAGSFGVSNAPTAIRLLGSPRWLAQRAIDGMRLPLPNVVGESGIPEVLGKTAPVTGLTWDDLPWIRDQWDGRLVIKGVLSHEEATRSVEIGADAVVVSNHGGRQLDHADGTLRVLPEVVAAVDGRCEVLLDGGVRSGIDVIKAISLGAGAVLIGRPWLWGLAAGGEAGISGVLQVLRDGMARNMTLMGVASIKGLDRSRGRAPESWFEPVR